MVTAPASTKHGVSPCRDAGVAGVAARNLASATTAGIAADAGNRVGVAIIISRRILCRPRRFAEHIEAREFRFLLVGALDRGVDRLAHNELLAKHFHRRKRRLADHRLARAADHRFEQGQRVRLAPHRIEHQRRRPE